MKAPSFWLKVTGACTLVAALGCGPGGSSGGTGTGASATGGHGGSAGGAAGASGAAGTDDATGDAGTSGGGGSAATGTAGDASGGGGSAGAGPGGATAGGGAGGAAAGGGAGARGGGSGTAGARGGSSGTAGRGGATGAAGASGGRGGTTGAAGSGPGGQPACPGTISTGSPPAPLTLSGSLGVHDPAALVVNSTIYMFATGLTAKTSTNLTSWQNGSNPLNPRPAWVATNVPGATNLWAPDISYFGGKYHLYYAASTFGSNKSCIGHATKDDVASGSWADQGAVICSNMGSNDNWNAIDPNIVIDDAGTPWMDFGSFWSGIKMIKLDATGGRATDDMTVYSIADRPSGRGGPEGPWIFKRCGYYYLFESWGACCDGAYDYNMRVGRSTSVNKDYVDKAGLKLLGGGGGTLVSQGNTTVHAPGHNAVIVYDNKTYNLYHALNASNGNASLRITELVWDADGWPVQHEP
jgi:arabinan endo-1,5-alpha-L-arabinosidase